VAVHGGTIRANNIAPHGLRVEIDLPTLGEAASSKS
jgi:hypothetical protein